MKFRLVLLLSLMAAVVLLGSAGAATDRSAACSNPPTTCKIKISANLSIGATVTWTFNGGGPFGPLACSPVCIDSSGTYNGNFVWTAHAPTNFRFTGWSGSCSGTGNCAFTLNNDINATANFERIKQTVTVQKTGNGTVRSEPGGIDCGNTCSAQFDQGSQVAFDAIPGAGSQFNGWGGACGSAGRNARCVITIGTSSVTITASFSPPPVLLTVTKSGRGTVTSAPAGINCGGACSANFPAGGQVTLTATPEPEYPFIGWGGACSGASPTCAVTINTATTVQARFAAGKVDAFGAGFKGTWGRSRYRGSLVLVGTATNAIDLTATVNSPSFSQTFAFAVPAGRFERLFPVPSTGVYPGSYAVSLNGVSEGAGILPRNATARMEPPGEGIVSRAWVTAGRGRPVTRAPRGTKRLVAHFAYVTKPFRGSKVTVSWFLRKRRLGTVKKIRWKPIVTTDVASAGGLPSGRYTCVLNARGRIVYEVAVRVG